MAGTLSPSRLLGALACVALGGLGAIAPALVLIASVVGVLIAVIAYEHMLAVRRSAAGEPSPLERLQERGRAS